MKLSLAVATLISFFALAENAGAVAIDFVSTTEGALGTSNTGSYTLTQDPGTSISDTLSGILATNTQVEITYNATAGSPYLLDLTASAAGNSELVQATASTSDILGTTPNQTNTMISLPVIVTAGFEGDPVGTSVIQNLSTIPVSFSSLFKAAIFSTTEGGETLVSYVVSEIPLPPAVVLFSLGLLTVAGYGFRKKESVK